MGIDALAADCPALLKATARNTAQLAELLRDTACQRLAAALLSSTGIGVWPAAAALDSAPMGSAAMPVPTPAAAAASALYAASTAVAPNLSVAATATAAGGFFAGMDSPEEDDLFVRVLMSTVFLVLSIMGVVGNVLVITVVSRVPGMITPTNCYLVSLAASDCLFFLVATPTELSTLNLTHYAFGSVGCALFSYLPYLAINTSSLSITAFTVERFIGICYPLRARYICTVSRAKLIIVLIWLFCLTYNSPWLYLATVADDADGRVCSFKLARDNWAYKFMFLNDFSAFYLFPMVLYMVVYTKIIYTITNGAWCAAADGSIAKASESRSSNGHSQSNGHTASNGNSVKKPLQSTNSSAYGRNNSISMNGRSSIFGGGRKGSTRSRVQVQVIKMLAVVVLIFGVCWLPYRAMVMYNSFATNKFHPDWYIFLSKTMIFFNCAINPILYNVMSGRFRNAFRRLLRGKDPKDGAKRQPTTTISKPLMSAPEDLRPFISPSTTVESKISGSP